MVIYLVHVIFFFFNDTATTEIYTLSLHDALPISLRRPLRPHGRRARRQDAREAHHRSRPPGLHARPHTRGRLHHPRRRSEEHTSELQSRQYLVCRLLLEKKKEMINLTRELSSQWA